MQIEVTETILDDIPLLTLGRQGVRRQPLIFFICGYGGRKEDGLSLAHKLARHGFFVVSFDPWQHGERYSEQLDRASEPAYGGIYPPETGLDTGVLFFHIIDRCRADVETLIAHFAADPRADTTACGVTGLSMGGYASYLIFARLPQMLAAAPMIGLPCFAQRWKDLVDETAYSNPAWGAALAAVGEMGAEHARFIAGIDPIEALKKAAPRALLIMNCDFDADQPKLYALNAFRELLPTYADAPESLQLRIYPTGHNVTSAMEDDVVAWFRRHLLDERPDDVE